ncbi:MAG: sulfurtransferase TusA family protein [Candidatus Hadarchaeum sp.]|uniref:sulfurtransferase TusA family protein n=1 Tax=Candidatus Hadarchaeum sp. TaxID=2883567 RepID=UPI003D116F23
MSKVKVDRTIDIRGEVCPYTFVKSKLALEELNGGQVLEIFLDHDPAVENVPRSLESDGHRILAVEKIEGGWRILVRKVQSR